MDKGTVRECIRERVQGLSPEDRAEGSRRIREHVWGLPEFRAGGDLLLFVSMPDEFDTRPLIRDALAAGKRVFLPKVDRRARRMRLLRLARFDALRPGAYGIEEPPDGEEAAPGSLDFILVPGRAFDLRGGRLGRGGGYYDRFLSDPRLRAPRCGAAYDCQVLEAVPASPHDVPVDMLVTETRTLRFRERPPRDPAGP